MNILGEGRACSVSSPPVLESREGSWERNPENQPGSTSGCLGVESADTSPGEQNWGALGKPFSHTF